jgi:hypothetical protein
VDETKRTGGCARVGEILPTGGCAQVGEATETGGCARVVEVRDEMKNGRGREKIKVDDAKYEHTLY